MHLRTRMDGKTVRYKYVMCTTYSNLFLASLNLNIAIVNYRSIIMHKLKYPRCMDATSLGSSLNISVVLLVTNNP